jgi:hypothetical protein
VWRVGPLLISFAVAVFLGTVGGAAVAGLVEFVRQWVFGVPTAYKEWWLWSGLAIAAWLQLVWLIGILRQKPL